MDSEEKPKDIDSMYESFVEESRQGVLLLQGYPPKIVYTNPAMRELSGYSKEEFLSFTFDDMKKITHPDDHDLVFGNIEAGLRGEAEPRQYVYRAIRKDGQIVWVEVMTRGIQHQSQPALLVSYLDVTDLKKAEKKIIEERDRAQLYLDWAGVMFLALDKDGSIVLLNQKGCEILGCQIDQSVGRNWFDTFLPVSIREDTRESFRMLMSGDIESIRERENFVITTQGVVKLISWHTTILRDKEDNIIGLLSSGVDVTERKKAEDALKESEQQYRTLVENLPVVTWTSDENGNTIYISPNVVDIYGFTPEEIAEGGQDLWFGRIHPEDLANVKAEYELSLIEKRDYEMVYRIQRKDEQWIWIHDISTRTYVENQIRFASGMFTDITEKKKIELALEESEERYRTLVESMQQGVAIIQDSNFVFTNNTLCEILDYSSEELLERPFLTLVSPHDKAFVAERYQKEISGEGIPQSLDIQVIKKDGSLPYVRLMGTLFEYQGRPAVLVTIDDITQRKKIEIALEESELKYRTLIESMMDGIAIHRDGKILFTNNASANILGYSSEEIEGSSFIELIHPDDRSLLIDINRRRMAGKEIPEEYEVRGIHKNGKDIILNIRGAIIDYEGRPAVAAIVRDVTIQREAEDTLRLVQYSIDHTSDPVFWIDKEGKFAYTNEAARKYLSFTIEEISEVTVWDIYPEFSSERGPQMLAQVKQKGSEVFEVLIKDKHGNLMPVEVTASYLIFEGRELFFTYVKDIQERKESEEALRKSTEELRATKDRALLYLDIMGHDIRNKLQGMMLASHLALIGNDSEEVKEAITIQEKAIETIQDLITRVKSLEEMVNEPLIQRDLVLALNDVVTKMKNQYTSTKCEIEIPFMQFNIRGDSFLETLIMNILENAVEHNQKDNPMIWVHMSRDDAGVKLSIADNGSGISDSRKSELLDPNRRYGGIALHQSKFIAEKYGGYIEISDRIIGKPEMGARFIIWLPTTPE
jgi:PAS domain S-box-containing protein